jgi:hypothetical protein
MYADDTSILNIGVDIQELKNLDNTGLVEHYFETSNLFINPAKTLYVRVYSISDKKMQAGK